VSSLVAEASAGPDSRYRQLPRVVDVVATVRISGAAEADAFLDRYSDFVPNPDVSTERNYFPRVYPRLIEILQLGSSGLGRADRARPRGAGVAGSIDRYYQSATDGHAGGCSVSPGTWAARLPAGRCCTALLLGDPAGLLAGRFST
jgi:hypothetical protein